MDFFSFVIGFLSFPVFVLIVLWLVSIIFGRCEEEDSVENS